MRALRCATHADERLRPHETPPRRWLLRYTLFMIRPATADDVSALVEIENGAFTTDRISRRAFRYLMSKANAATLVAVEEDGEISGYVIVLFNRGTSLARLYSVAVDTDRQRHGIGGGLLAAAEAVERHHAAAYMRLEV